jgi:hypothetical protein
VAHKKCWTADHLAHHGMDHPDKCPLCDQEEETIDHLLVSCAFAKQFWFTFLSQVNLQVLSPQPEDSSFLHWWEKASRAVTGQARKGLDSLFILGAWVLWKHRNRRVFDAAPPNLAAALSQAGEERLFWELPGAQGIASLTAPPPSRVV